MQTLRDLLNSPQGLGFLEAKGVFVAQQDFVERLEVPINSTLAKNLGLENSRLVYAAQQIYVDCTQSMLSRIELLRDLEQTDNLCPFFLWVDTDRAGSDEITVKFSWPLSGKNKIVRICSRATEDAEPRFIALNASELRQAVDKLGMYLTQSIEAPKRAQARLKYDQFRALFLAGHSGTLSEFNHQVIYFLLNHHAGLNPRSVILSDLINRGLITAEINLLLNHLEDAIKVFNETVSSLMQREVDPQVRPLAEDYLPLHFSCPLDQRRLKLHREKNGPDQFALANCQCGENYRFYLGSQTRSIAEIAQTGRWSPDVLLLLFFNDLVSGYVAGKSSALYGLVLNEVLRQVLGQKPVPVLVPESLGVQANEPGQVDSLIYQYLTDYA